MGAHAQPLLKPSENQGLEALTFKPCPQALFKVKGWVQSPQASGEKQLSTDDPDRWEGRRCGTSGGKESPVAPRIAEGGGRPDGGGQAVKPPAPVGRPCQPHCSQDTLWPQPH